MVILSGSAIRLGSRQVGCHSLVMVRVAFVVRRETHVPVPERPSVLTISEAYLRELIRRTVERALRRQFASRIPNTHAPRTQKPS